MKLDEVLGGRGWRQPTLIMYTGHLVGRGRRDSERVGGRATTTKGCRGEQGHCDLEQQDRSSPSTRIHAHAHTEDRALKAGPARRGGCAIR